MEIDWLEDFLALAEARNFSRAADMRHVSQPAFSRRIRALEDWVGATLFDRGAQGAALTPAGLCLHPLAEDLLQRLNQARRDTRAAGETEAPALAVAATHALSFTFFPAWIGAHLDYGRLGALNLISDTMEACEQLMLSGEVHFLLCHHHPAAPIQLDLDRFETAVVGQDMLIPLCAPDAQGCPVWPLTRGANGSRVLSYGAASGLGRILAATQAVQPGEAATEPIFTSHLAATLLAMARGGEGAAWLPESLAAADLASGRLVRAAPPALDLPLEIRLYRSAGRQNATADEFWRRVLGGVRPSA